MVFIVIMVKEKVMVPAVGRVGVVVVVFGSAGGGSERWVCGTVG